MISKCGLLDIMRCMHGDTECRRDQMRQDGEHQHWSFASSRPQVPSLLCPTCQVCIQISQQVLLYAQQQRPPLAQIYTEDMLHVKACCGLSRAGES